MILDDDPPAYRERSGRLTEREIQARSFLLAALDERIKAAVDVGWMTSFRSQIRAHVTSTVSLSFHINGLYRDLDLPDLASLIAPRTVLVINGSQDRVFALDGV